MKFCYQAHSKDIYSLKKDFPETFDFCNYTYVQILQNDELLYQKYIIGHWVQQEISVVICKLWVHFEISLIF